MSDFIRIFGDVEANDKSVTMKFQRFDSRMNDQRSAGNIFWDICIKKYGFVIL